MDRPATIPEEVQVSRVKPAPKEIQVTRVKLPIDIPPTYVSEYEQAIQAAGMPQTPSWDGGQDYDYTPFLLDKVRRRDRTPLEVDRRSFVHKYGFAIPNREALLTLAKYQPILEVGCGGGYWAYEMQKVGIQVVPTDPAVWEVIPEHGSTPIHPDHGFTTKWVDNIKLLNGVDAVTAYPNHTLFLCWPSYSEDWAAQTLQSYYGNTLVYVGEHGGCCANDRLFELLDTGWEEVEIITIPRWFGIHDYLWVYTRK